MENTFVLIDTVRIVMYVLIGLAIIYLLYKLYLLGKYLGGGIVDGAVAAAKAVWGLATNKPVTVDELFTTRQDDGTVSAHDTAPAGTDAIDWIFMNHDLSDPV